MLDDGLDDANNLQGNGGHHLCDVPAGPEQRSAALSQGRGTGTTVREGALAWKPADLVLRAGFLLGRRGSPF